MGILDYSDCFLKLECNHIIDKVTLPYTLYLATDFLFSNRFNLTCSIHDEDLVSSCSVNKVLRFLFDPGGSSACSTGPSCGRDHYSLGSLGSMKLKECIRLSTLVTHGLMTVNLRKLRGGGFFIDGLVCVSTNRYPYMQTSVVFQEYRKVIYRMVEAGRFVTTENQWCNDFKIEKDKCMKFLEGSKVRAQEDDGRMEILDCIIIDNAPAFICSVHEVQGVLAQSFLAMWTCLMPCREAVQNSMGMDQFYIDDSFSVANICYMIHGDNMIDLSNWDGFDLAGANTKYLSSHLIGVNKNRIYDLFIQEASDTLDVHQNVCNHMSVTEGNKNLAETTNMDATIQSCVYWMRYRVHLLAAAHGIDDVRVAIDQSFPALRILCRIYGLCAISVYILEDKDDFERVGKRIISMVIMGWRTFDKSTWDHEYTVEPELIGVLSVISIMSTYRAGQFEMSELSNEILKQLESLKNMSCWLFSLECGKLSKCCCK